MSTTGKEDGFQQEQGEILKDQKEVRSVDLMAFFEHIHSTLALRAHV